MTTPVPEDRQRERVVTWRAMLAGSACVVLISIGAPFGALKVQTATMALDFSVPAAIFSMFLLAVVVNLVRVATGRSLLNRGEMLVAYSMMAVACAIATMGLTAYLVPMAATPHYYASPENRWNDILLPYTPSWLMVSTRGEGANAIRYMFEGVPSDLTWGQTLAIAGAWAKPLAFWGIFLLALYATSICLMAVFRKQWVDHERILFPLAQLPMELAGEPTRAGGRITPLFKNWLLWVGFAIPFIFTILKALPAYFPLMSGLDPKQWWQVELLERNWRCQFYLSWQTIGLAYLLSNDVGLCVWLFGLLGGFYDGLSKFSNFKSPEKLGIYGAAPAPDLGHFGMGAMIALVVLRLWIGRKHLRGVLRRAFFLPSDVDDRSEPMSYRAAVWGALTGGLVMTLWLRASGLPLHIALIILFAAFVGFVGLTRVIAESGMPVSIVPLISSDFVVSALGTSAVGQKGLVAMPWTYVWNGDVRTFVMCSAAHGMRACSERRRSYRGLFLAMMFAVVLALVASVAATLYLAYGTGGVNLHKWFFISGPKRPFEFIGSLLRSPPRPPNGRGWITTGIGAAAMVLFTLARLRFVWWPINPVGLPVAVVGWTQNLWFSVFLAWLVKNRVLKYGGPKLYLALRPLFLGLVLGQYAGAAFWIVIDGLTGTVGRSVFWI